MSILFHFPGDPQHRLLTALQQRLPDKEFINWPATPNDQVTQAAVWQAPADFFTGFNNISTVFSLAAGVDHLLNHPGLPETAAIVRLHDAGMAVRMEEYVLYGVLHAHRQFPALNQAQREQQWMQRARTPRANRFAVGILGAGALGSRVATRLQLNGYTVSCWSRSKRQLPAGIEAYAGQQALAEFLAPLSALVCLLPLTSDTRGILNQSLFDGLPDGTFLINAARGDHLHEADFLAALDNGKLSGALLDVFQTEPLPADHRFWRDQRIIVTPHLAAPTPIRESADQIAENIRLLDRGETPLGLVDRSLGY